MSSPVVAPPSVSTDGGGDHWGLRREQGHRRNRMKRSLLRIVGWNAEGLRTKVPELQSWLPLVSADVVAIQEAQFSAKTAILIPRLQPPVFTRRERGRTTSAAAVVKGGDVAIRGGIPFSPCKTAYLTPRTTAQRSAACASSEYTPSTLSASTGRPSTTRHRTTEKTTSAQTPSHLAKTPSFWGTSTPTTHSGTTVATRQTTSVKDWRTGSTEWTGRR